MSSSHLIFHTQDIMSEELDRVAGEGSLLVWGDLDFSVLSHSERQSLEEEAAKYLSDCSFEWPLADANPPQRRLTTRRAGKRPSRSQNVASGRRERRKRIRRSIQDRNQNTEQHDGPRNGIGFFHPFSVGMHQNSTDHREDTTGISNDNSVTTVNPAVIQIDQSMLVQVHGAQVPFQDPMVTGMGTPYGATYQTPAQWNQIPLPQFSFAPQYVANDMQSSQSVSWSPGNGYGNLEATAAPSLHRITPLFHQNWQQPSWPRTLMYDAPQDPNVSSFEYMNHLTANIWNTFPSWTGPVNEPAWNQISAYQATTHFPIGASQEPEFASVVNGHVVSHTARGDFDYTI